MPKTEFELAKELFASMRIPFTLTDDSEESSAEKPVDTVIVIEGEKGDKKQEILFFFTADGKFKNEVKIH